MKLLQRDAGTAPTEAERWRHGSRVAFFGGSFDPPHLGHLAVARAARTAFALDTVLFAPVGMQPLKRDGACASFEDRVEMTRLAIAGEPGFEVSRIDAPKPPAEQESRDAGGWVEGAGSRLRMAPNYTIETLEGLRGQLAPGSALFCLMGADSFMGLRHWRRAAEIPFVAQLIVAARPGQALEGLQEALPPGLVFEPAPEAERCAAGVAVRGFSLRSEAGDRATVHVLAGLHVEISASEIRAQLESAADDAAAGGNRLPAAVRDYIVRHELYRA